MTYLPGIYKTWGSSTCVVWLLLIVYLVQTSCVKKISSARSLFIQKISALGNNKGEQLFYYTGQTKLLRFLNYLTAILTANNELFNSAPENDDEFRMYVRNYYFFLTFRNDLFLCVWNQFMSIIVEIVTFLVSCFVKRNRMNMLFLFKLFNIPYFIRLAIVPYAILFVILKQK